ncbi:MAG: hypothetical protein A2487_21370 [Candidatus Raymondbacteria bacterium RifOxyC12_full_50_8]|nr:MAG: hypothetical protein A2487_21370 [Candidatus Raymondbacteria bacterium RifOxyC12_full_50_8]
MIVKVFFILLIASVIYSQENIAVLDLEADAVTASEAKTLTNKLRGELINTGHFTVIERGQMDEILKEQGFQQTGCTSQECAVEVGQLLGVKYMVAGSIGKVGSIFLVSLRLIDVTKGNIVNPVDQEVDGDVSDVLRQGLHDAARKLAGLEPDHAPPPKKAAQAEPVWPAYQEPAKRTARAPVPFGESLAVERRQPRAVPLNKAPSRRTFSVAWGMSSLDLRSFHWQEKDSFDIEFTGLKWNSGNHFEFDIAPMRLYAGDTGSSGIMFANELGGSFDMNSSASSLATLMDSAAPVAVSVQLQDGAFTMKRFGIIDKLALGYFFKLPYLALEPYLGISGQFDFDGISGKAVNNKSLMTIYLRFGFPLGIRLYYNRFLVGFEYSTFFKAIQIDDNLDYDGTTKQSIIGAFSQEGDAFWTIHIGHVF